MEKQWDAIWVNGKIVTCEAAHGLIEQGAIATKDDKIAWLGKYSDLSAFPDKLANRVYDLQGGCLTPGLIDCHTHLIYAGNRTNEFEWRLQGLSYESIAKKGGGIQTTVNATRAASMSLLYQASMARAQALIQSGVTTIEIKSGYGLDLETEIKILKVADQIAATLPLTVYKTFLGAHSIPNEYKGKESDYVRVICDEMIPQIAREKLAEAVDVFCEKIAFSLEQTACILKTAKQYGLAIKCHSEQLSDSGSAALAASLGALSVDHLEYLSETSIKAMASAGTVAVLLPGAYYFLQETQLPPVHLLRQYGVPIALASDCNPGSSPVLSLPLMLNMACTLFNLTVEEAWLGVTKYAARALGLEKTHGSLDIGKIADFAIWQISHPIELVYYLGHYPLSMMVKRGQVI